MAMMEQIEQDLSVKNLLKVEVANDSDDGYSNYSNSYPYHAASVLDPSQVSNISDLGKKLLDAAREGNEDDVKELMQSGAPFAPDWMGSTPLHFAAQNGHVKVAELLLRNGISRDARNKVEHTALHLAAQNGQLKVVELLVNNGCDIDAVDMLSMTPLHWAVERGHKEVMEFLCESGADVSMKTKFKQTPLEISIDQDTSYSTDHLAPLLKNYIAHPRPKVKPVIQSVTPTSSRGGSTLGFTNGFQRSAASTQRPLLARMITPGSRPGYQHIGGARILNGSQVVAGSNSSWGKVNLDRVRKALREADLNSSSINIEEEDKASAVLAALNAISKAATTGNMAGMKEITPDVLRILEQNGLVTRIAPATSSSPASTTSASNSPLNLTNKPFANGLMKNGTKQLVTYSAANGRQIVYMNGAKAGATTTTSTSLDALNGRVTKSPTKIIVKPATGQLANLKVANGKPIFVQKVIQSNGTNGSTMSQSSSSSESADLEEKLSLAEREIQQLKRDLAETKRKLQEKDRECASYKKQLALVFSSTDMTLTETEVETS